MNQIQNESLHAGQIFFLICASVAGTLFGYLEGHEPGHHVLATMKGIPPKPFFEESLYELIENMVIGLAMGLTAGTAISCFAIAIAHLLPEYVAEEKRRMLGSYINGKFVYSNIKTYFKKADIDENKKSILRMSEKYTKQKQKQDAETKIILEVGTEGLKAQKFGKTTGKGKK